MMMMMMMMMIMMMIWCFMSLSTLFKSYQDDGRVITLCNEMPLSWAEFQFQWDSNPHLMIQSLDTIHLATQALLKKGSTKYFLRKVMKF